MPKPGTFRRLLAIAAGLAIGIVGIVAAYAATLPDDSSPHRLTATFKGDSAALPGDPSYPHRVTTATSGGDVTRGVVDCRSVGKVLRTSDRSEDVEPSSPAHPPTPHPDLDLLGARVARSGDKLCFAMTTKARPQEGSVLELQLRKKGCAQSGPLVMVAVIFYGGERLVRVTPVDNEHVDNGIRHADVRQAGNTTSVVIGRDQLPEWAPIDDFMWQADGISLQTHPQYTDSAPDGAPILYPEGTRDPGLRGCRETEAYGVVCDPLPRDC
jgi:hypothetical protein